MSFLRAITNYVQAGVEYTESFFALSEKELQKNIKTMKQISRDLESESDRTRERAIRRFEGLPERHQAKIMRNASLYCDPRTFDPDPRKINSDLFRKTIDTYTEQDPKYLNRSFFCTMSRVREEAEEARRWSSSTGLYRRGMRDGSDCSFSYDTEESYAFSGTDLAHVEIHFGPEGPGGPIDVEINPPGGSGSGDGGFGDMV